MVKGLVVFFLAATVVAVPTAVLVAPAAGDADSSAPAFTRVAAFTGASAFAGVAASPTATLSSTAKPHLVKYKIYFGRCKDTCLVKVRITNISRKTLYAVSLNARLKVNGKKVGSCYDYVGTIRAKRTRWGSCTVRTRTLSNMWNRWLDGEIRFDRDVNTVVHYEYYR